MKPIYLDYNATTPVDHEVAEAMKPYLEEHFGNPSSLHLMGIAARKSVENARRQVADLLNCIPEEIVFTSGGTESNNYAIKGIAFANRRKGHHIITTTIEHPAVTEVCNYLEAFGFRTTYIPVDETGLIDPGKLEKAITNETILITIMHANNEVGTIQPIEDISVIAHKHGIFCHTDAAQSVGKISTDVNSLNVDLLSVAGHKVYAPKGIGALFIREGIQLEKFMHGAGHERNLRAGTENVLEIIGLGKACEIAKRDLDTNMAHMMAMRDRLHNGLKNRIASVRLNGHPEKRLPNTLSIGFKGLEASALLNDLMMADIAASAGSACHAGSTTVSHVLEAMNVSLEYAVGTLRLSVGKMTTEDEIDRAIAELAKAVQRYQK
ncbi:MAG: cysteine desulfurase [Deltaproteobacteria bacterium]|nr:cysteine desulfurase [Deltaproteobacteria bacterium]